MGETLVAAGGTLYLVGGGGDNVERWDPVTETCSVAASLPWYAHNAGVALYNSNIVGVGGSAYGQATTFVFVGNLLLGA